VETEQQTIQSEKLMLIDVSNSTIFSAINVIMKDAKFNARHFITHIVDVTDFDTIPPHRTGSFLGTSECHSPIIKNSNEKVVVITDMT
jgi:ferritin-like protein